MKRFRLSTLLLLVVIAALSIVLVMQQVRTARLVAEMEAMQTRERAVRAMAEANLERTKAALNAFEHIEAPEGASR